MEAISEGKTYRFGKYVLAFQGRRFQLNLISDERVMTKILKRCQTTEFNDFGSKSHI